MSPIQSLLYNKLWLEPSITLNQSLMENILEKVCEYYPFVKTSLKSLNKIYIFETGECFETELTHEFKKHGMIEEEIGNFFFMYDLYSEKFGFRGLNIQDKGIVVINLFMIKDCAGYFVRSNKSRIPEAWNFSVRDSHYADLDSYATSEKLCTNFLFWNTLIHELRHTEQYHNPMLNIDMYNEFVEFPQYSKDETDAVGFAKCVFKKVIQKVDYQIIK